MPTVVTHRFDAGIAHLETRMARLAGNWAIGSTGAVGAKTGGIGMTLSRTDVGTYRVQLTDSHGVAASVPAILAPQIMLEEADADPSDDTTAHFVKLLATSASNGQVDFHLVDEAGAVREAASGARIHVGLDIKLSSVTR